MSVHKADFYRTDLLLGMHVRTQAIPGHKKEVFWPAGQSCLQGLKALRSWDELPL